MVDGGEGAKRPAEEPNPAWGEKGTKEAFLEEVLPQLSTERRPGFGQSAEKEGQKIPCRQGQQ